MSAPEPSPQGTQGGQTAPPQTIPITPENYPVLNRWMELESQAFQQELNTLAAIGRETAQPDSVQRAIRAAVSALEALHRRR